jgi:hypothetical protein
MKYDYNPERVEKEQLGQAIERFKQRNQRLSEVMNNGDAGCVDMETWDKYNGFRNDNLLAITALEQMKPKYPCEYCELEQTEHIYAYGMNSRKISVQYCPNCGRKLKGESNE